MIAALAGWLTASVAAMGALAAWRMLTVRAEAVARASHELRGPLTAARLGLELGIRSGQLAGDRLRAIELELGSATLALDDLGGERSMRARFPTEFNLMDLVSDVVVAWRAAADASDVCLSMHWTAGPARVRGDRLRIAQALGNLIANAIEHGGEWVEVRGAQTRGVARVEVLDGGPGLPARIDELARRAGRGGGRAARARKRAGRGRGLAIAVAIAEAQGGRISSAPSDRGARVVLELPVKGS